MLLATKGGIIPGVPYDSSAPYLASAIDASLRRLRTERVELWQIHRPDLLAHQQEIARTLEEAHGAGTNAAIRVSIFHPAQTSAPDRCLPVPLCSPHCRVSPLHTTPHLIGNSTCRKRMRL